MHNLRSPKFAILLAVILGGLLAFSLTASSLAGHARPLMSQEVNGMLVTEGAPVIGVALSAPLPGQATIPVFVTLR